MHVLHDGTSRPTNSSCQTKAILNEGDRDSDMVMIVKTVGLDSMEPGEVIMILD